MQTISVAVTTYNGETYLERQLQSLLLQSRQPDEVIICDDGSTDGTWEILRRLKETDPARVHIFRNEERLGFRRNFLKAASLCQCDLIAFCDQDDIWHSEKLERVMNTFRPGVSMVFHGAQFIDGIETDIGEMGRLSSTMRTFGPLELDAFAKVLGFSMVFRRTLCQFDDHHCLSIDDTDDTQVSAHDQWYTFLAGVFGEVMYLPDPLVRYRLHDTNAMGFRRKHGLMDLVSSYQHCGLNLRKRMRVLRARCVILESLAKEHGEAKTALESYRNLENVGELRLSLYLDTNPIRRVLRYFGLRKLGIYRSTKLPLSRWDERKDLLASLLGPGLMLKA